MVPGGEGRQRNPLVFLDISIAGEKAGRVVIELRSDVVPRTAENFRALSTGERGLGNSGRPLHYKGCRFHKAVRQFMVQSGDVVNGDGSGGESIYGPSFPDENFTLEHDVGVLSMANAGRPHTNGSQFCVTTVPCSHLDGTNVVFGRVVSGLGILEEVQTYSVGDDCRPAVDCIIQDCGEMRDFPAWGIPCDDGTADRLPEYPDDYRRLFVTLTELIEGIKQVKTIGNDLFEMGRYRAAARKYMKSLRYIKHVKDKARKMTDEHESLKWFALTRTYRLQCNLNLAACFIKLQDYGPCIKSCHEVLHFEPQNEKALYRRAQANFAIGNYDDALEDLRKADEVSPNNKAVLKLLDQVRSSYKQYNGIQKQRLSKFFREHDQKTVFQSASH